jgi:flagellar biosynthesis chaperone FliJ
MRNFKFRLQRALRFSLLRENQKKAQIAAGMQRMGFLKLYLEQLDRRLKTALSKGHEEFQSLEGQAHRQAVVPTLEESRRMDVLLKEESDYMAQRQKELRHLSQRRRSLESLKEKHLQKFRLESTRAEQKSIDDAVSLKQAREIARNEEGQ